MTPEELAVLKPFDVEKIHDFAAFLEECRTHSISEEMYQLIHSSLNLMVKELVEAGHTKIDPEMTGAGYTTPKIKTARFGYMLTIKSTDGEVLMGFAFGMSEDMKVIETFSRMSPEKLAFLLRPPLST